MPAALHSTELKECHAPFTAATEDRSPHAARKLAHTGAAAAAHWRELDGDAPTPSARLLTVRLS
jgi:hypothetical protein